MFYACTYSLNHSFIHLLIHSFIFHSFIRSFMHSSFFHSFAHSFIFHSFLIFHSFNRSFLHLSFIHSLIYSFIFHSFICSFIHSSFIHSFAHSFIFHSFLHFLIHSFILSFLLSFLRHPDSSCHSSVERLWYGMNEVDGISDKLVVERFPNLSYLGLRRAKLNTSTFTQVTTLFSLTGLATINLDGLRMAGTEAIKIICGYVCDLRFFLVMKLRCSGCRINSHRLLPFFFFFFFFFF